MKKSRLVFALTLLVGMPVLMYLLSTLVERRYTAQVRMQVDPMGLRTEYPDPFAPFTKMAEKGQPRNTATQIQVITGTEVLGRAIAKVRQDNPGLIPNDQSAAVAYESLVKRLQVDNDPMSDVVALRVTQNSQQLAAELANNIAYAYQDYVNEKQKASTESMEKALNYQVNLMKNRLATIDAQIAALNEQANIADPIAAEQANTNEASSTRQLLESTRSQLQGAIAERDESIRILKGIKPTIVSSSSVQYNPVVQAQQTDISRLYTQLASLRSQFSDDYPEVKAMKEQIRQAESDLRKAKQNIDAGTTTSPNPAYQQQQAAVNASQANVNKLREAVASLEVSAKTSQARVDILPAIQKKISGLQRERIAAEASYGQIVQRRDVTEAAAASQQSSIEIVSQAQADPNLPPSFPDPRLFVLAGLAVGGFLAILILMPRQEAPAIGDYYPALYTPPTAPAAPPEAAVARDPAVAPTTTDSAGLEAGVRRDG